MRSKIRSWKDVSIAHRLYLVVGVMAILILGELLTLRFAMQTLSSVRAFVGGESLWSKAQKSAVLDLQRYAVTHDEGDYQAFVNDLRVTDGDHLARMELSKPSYDFAAVQRGFVQGKIHPDDVPGLVKILRRFSQVSYVQRAVTAWSRADDLLAQLKATASEYHSMVTVAAAPDPSRVRELLLRMRQLDVELTGLEEEFSNALGEGSRWLERMVLSLLLLAVLTVETIGLTLTFRTSRSISRGLSELNTAAQKIGQGEFQQRVSVRSNDEIGQLGRRVNEMGEMLHRSYSELEQRVHERTAKLEALAAQNEKLYEESKAAVQTRDEFLSIASHELRTPLTSLHLQLQLLERALRRIAPGEETTKAGELAHRSSQQVQRMTRLIDELLDLTRIREGRLEIHREPCDLAALCADVVAQFAPDAARVGTGISLVAPAPVPGQFDQMRVFQVVTNLVSNAIKYGRGAPIEVRVRTNGGEVQLEVQDRGPGIPPEHQARIFDRFERAAEDATVVGLGLGLYISRQIVQAHGGALTLQSAVGAGSTFTVILPRASA